MNYQHRLRVGAAHTNPRDRSGQHSRLNPAVTLAIGMLLAAAGLAQAQAQSQSQPASEAAATSAGLQEVVVTANKREETLTQAPLAVSALSQDQLTNAGVVGLTDLTSSVPNVEIRSIGFANSVQIAIRGVSNNDFNQTGNPAVATYIDGVYVSRTEGLNGALFDLEQIEVLRGPQGTLYGRNSTGGNLNIVTASPKQSFDAQAGLEFGNYGDIQSNGMINVPVTDTFAVRLAAETHTNQGYFDTEGTTSRNYGAADDHSVRLSGLWQPTSDFSWKLTVEDFESNGTPGLDIATGPNGKPADGLPVYNRPVTPFPDPDSHIENFGVRTKMNYQINDIASLSYIGGYQHLDSEAQFVLAGAPLDGIRHDKSNSYSHEIDFNINDGPVDNLFGGSYFHGRSTNFDAYHFYSLGYTDSDIAPPAFVDADWGVFDQATVKVTDAFRIIGGVRYSHETQTYSGDNLYLCPLSTTFAQMLDSQFLPGCSAAYQTPSAGTWHAVTWKAGVEYDLSQHTSGYTTVTTGFKSGGLNVGIAVAPTFAPEKITNYETGIKTLLLDNHLRLNLALFYEDYTNIQVSQTLPNGEGSVTENAAGATSWGLELEGEWLITPRDHLNGFLTYDKATYTDYHNAVDDYTGDLVASLDGHYLPHAPLASGRLHYGHDFDFVKGWIVTPSVSLYAQSTSYLREFNLLIDKVPSYTKTDLSLTFTDDAAHWNAAAFVENLENNAIRTNGAVALGYVSDYAPPRLYGVRVSYKY
jgi:iron complex outermembrane recepter protein